jgi:chromosome segregation ATPase
VATTEHTSYPLTLRRLDEDRGRRDGVRRTPALAEVRRRQQELRETGGQLTVGYQVVLLTEMGGELNALFPAYQRTGQAMLRDIRQHLDRIEEAERRLRRAEDRLSTAEAALTREELLPRNPEEEGWERETLRNRREVERSRRIGRAQDAVDAARDHLNQRRAECTAAERRRDEAMADFGLRAQRIKELYQRRIATYVDALARSHPDGRTLNPLLSMTDIPLPEWVPEILLPHGPDPSGGEA